MECTTVFTDAFLIFYGGALVIGGFVLGRIVRNLTN